jgi:hypothetical protein
MVPDLCLTTVSILTQLIPRYQLLLKWFFSQEEEADTEDDDEYVPPTLIMDTELDYGEIEPEASSEPVRIDRKRVV